MFPTNRAGYGLFMAFARALCRSQRDSQVGRKLQFRRRRGSHFVVEHLEDRTVLDVTISNASFGNLMNNVKSQLGQTRSAAYSALDGNPAAIPGIGMTAQDLFGAPSTPAGTTNVSSAVNQINNQITNLVNSLSSQGPRVAVQQAIYNALQDVIADNDDPGTDVDQNDVVIRNYDDTDPTRPSIEIDINLYKHFQLQDKANFDLGLPGFPLEVTSNGVLDVDVQFRYQHLIYGLNRGEFYIDTARHADEITIGFSAQYDADALNAQFGFLEIQARQDAAPEVAVQGNLSLDVTGDAASGPDVRDPRIFNADLHVSFPFETKPIDLPLPGFQLPNIRADLLANWHIDHADPTTSILTWGSALPQVNLNDIRIQVSGMLNHLLAPMVLSTRFALMPMQLYFEVAKIPIPGVSQLWEFLTGNKVSLLSLTKEINDIGIIPEPLASMMNMVNTFSGFVNTMNAFSTPLFSDNLSASYIPLCSIDFTQGYLDLRAFPRTWGNQSIRSWISNPLNANNALTTLNPLSTALGGTLEAGLNNVPEEVRNTAAYQSGVNSLRDMLDRLSPANQPSISMSIPLLENPTENLYKLFTGGENFQFINVAFRVPPQDFLRLNPFDTDFPIIPSFPTRFDGSMIMGTNLSVGFDTAALRGVIARGASGIFDGFNFDYRDPHHPGQFLKPFTFSGEISLAGGIGGGIGIAEAWAGLTARLTTQLDVAFDDPNNDGFFRPYTESNDLERLFKTSGAVKASLDVSAYEENVATGRDYIFGPVTLASVDLLNLDSGSDSAGANPHNPYPDLLNDLLRVVPRITVGDATIIEGSDGVQVARFPVRLSAITNQTVTVDFRTVAGGTATSDDFSPTTGTLTFAPDEYEKFIDIPVTPDTRMEHDETFVVNLFNPVNGKIVDNFGLGTIIDDDIEAIYTTPTGPFDLTWGTGGIVRSFGSASNVLLDPDGRVVTFSISNGTSSLNGVYVHRYNPNGTADLTFNQTGQVYATGLTGIVSMPAFPVGAVYQKGPHRGKTVTAVGFGGSGFFPPTTRIVRLNLDGALDATFGGGTGSVPFDFPIGGGQPINQITIDQDDRILAVGWSGGTVFDGPGRLIAARYTSSGSLDPTFGVGGKVNFLWQHNDTDAATTPYDAIGANRVAVDSEGRVLIAGYAALPNYSEFPSTSRRTGGFVLRLTRGGSIDRSFGTNGITFLDFAQIFVARSVNDMVLSPDGKITVVGSEYHGGRFYMARLTAEGQLDATFDGDGYIDPGLTSNSVVLDAVGNVLVSGSGDPAYHLARLKHDGSFDNSFDTVQHDHVIAPSIGNYGNVGESILLPNGNLLLTGNQYDRGSTSIEEITTAAYQSQRSDLAVTMTTDISQALVDQTITYTIRVRNLGDDAVFASWRDILPAHTTFVSLVMPEHWFASMPDLNTHGTVTAATRSLTAADGEQVFVLKVKLDGYSLATQVVPNTVTVSSAWMDPNAANNSASVTDTINTAPLAINDTPSTDAVHTITFDVLANDSDSQNNIVPTATVHLTSPILGVLTNNGDGTFRYDPAGAFDDLAVGESAIVSFTYRTFDAFGASAVGTVTINVSGVNRAPVVNPAGTPTLNGIERNPLANPGTSVATLLARTLYSDTDNYLAGIAITAVDNANGQWQVAFNGSSAWMNVSGLSAANALHLFADNVTRIRFVPNLDFAGTASITYQGWDHTNGLANGDLGSTAANGGSTAYSSAVENATIQVSVVQTSPQLISRVPDPVNSGTVSNGTLGNSRTMSSDGGIVVFASSSSNLTLRDTNAANDLFVRDTTSNTVRMVTTNSAGVQANGTNSGSGFSLSGDGRWVAFHSTATNLIPGVTGSHIYIKDLQTGLVTLGDSDANGVVGNVSSEHVTFLSENGRYLFFTSAATNLVPNDTNARSDLFRKDLQTGAIVRVNTSAAGVQTVLFITHFSSSADGRFVAFSTSDANLVPGDVNGISDIFVKDLKANTIRRFAAFSLGSSSPVMSADGGFVVFISQTNSFNQLHKLDLRTEVVTVVNSNLLGQLADTHISGDVSISANGRFVSFSSSATNLAPGDTNARQDVFVKDTWTGDIRRANVTNAGGQAVDGGSQSGTLSADGRYVVFLSNANGLVSESTFGTFQVFKKDLQTEAITLISKPVIATPNGYNILAGRQAVSADQRYVAYTSTAMNIVPEDTNPQTDVYWYDTLTRTTRFVNASATGAAGMAGVNPATSGLIAISADGRFVYFSSNASNLVAGDTNGAGDVFRKDMFSGEVMRVSVAADSSQLNGDSSNGFLSADGRVLAFQTSAAIAPSDTNFTSDIYVKDLVTGAINLASSTSSGAAGNGHSYSTSLSWDGRFVVFSSAASNLIANDTNGNFDVFLKDMLTGSITRVKEGDSYAMISLDGRYVAYDQTAIFVKDLLTGLVVRADTTQSGTQANDSASFGQLGHGRYIAFASRASNLVAGDTNGRNDLFIKDLRTGAITRLSVSNTAEQTNGDTQTFSFSADARSVAFSTLGDNLTPDDLNLNSDVFLASISLTNTAPVAQDDALITAKDTPLFLTDATANDTDADGDPLTMAQFSKPNHGTIVHGIGAWQYIPQAGFVGVDTFTYRASDGLDLGNLVTVTINITASNRTPTNLSLSNATILHLAGSNVTIGNLSTTDPDAGDTFTYALVNGIGSTDNQLFHLSANQLVANASLNYFESPTRTVRIRTTDQGGLWFERSFTITVFIPFAPVLDLGGASNLDSIVEDTASASITGTSIATILSRALYSDGNASDPRAVAITGAETANGQWQYSLNNGSTWTNMPAVSNSDALHLFGDATTKLRFVPNPNFTGVAKVFFRAWDRSNGFLNGAIGDTSISGGSTAYSTAVEAAPIAITPVNDAPVINISGNPVLDNHTSANPGTLISDLVNRTLYTDPDTARQGTYLNFASTNMGQAGAIVGDSDKSVRFNGSNAYITVPDDPSLRMSGDLTVELWMNKAAESGWVRLAGKGNVNQRNYGVWEWFGSDGRILFQWQTTTGLWGISSVTNTVLNQWYHITATINGNVARLYINGNLEATATFTGTLVTTADPLTVGYSTPGYDGNHTYFNGRLDDVAVYNTGLSAGAIANHYNAGINGTGTYSTQVMASLPSAYYRLGDDAPTLAVDSAGVPALRGIAVNGLQSTNGVWQYSLNSGVNWSNFGSVSDSSARLLAADANTRVRFVPNAGFNGTATFNYRGWDRTNGLANGTSVFISSVGGATPFSQAVEAASISVGVVNTPPTIAANNATVITAEGLVAINTGVFADAQGTSTVTLSANIGVVTQNNTNGTWTWTLSAADGPGGPIPVTITATDNQLATATATFTFSITNVEPTLTMSGPSATAEGSLYILQLSTSDPGADTIDHWTITWGDGVVQTVSGNPTSVTHTYTDGPNTRTISATATDEDGTYAAGNTVSVTIDNVAPTVTISGPPNVNEGSLYTLTLSSSDQGMDTIDHWTITWGDGAVQTVSGNPTSVTHTYADGSNAYIISATATDEDGTYAAGNTVSVIVNNVPPTLSLSGAATVNEGSLYTLTLSSSDPGMDTIDHWTITWGDGAVQTVSGNPTSVTHTYADGPNAYVISATATDEDGTYAAGNTVSVTVDNVAPMVSILNVLGTVLEGTSILFESSIRDPGVLDTLIRSWTITKNGNPYSTGTGATFPFTPDDNGTYVITLTGTDDDHDSGTDTKTIEVTNVRPTATLSQNGPVTVGNPVTVSFSDLLDPSNVDQLMGFRASYDFNNDGDFTDEEEGEDLLNVLTRSHRYASAGDFLVRARIKDKDGDFTEYFTTVRVNSAVSVLAVRSELTVKGFQGVALGLVPLATFTDSRGVQALSSYAATIDWKDGSVTSGTIQIGEGGTLVVLGDHVYTTSGTKRPTVRLTILGSSDPGASAVPTLSVAEDVTARTLIRRGGSVYNRSEAAFYTSFTVTNISSSSLQGALRFVLTGLTPGITVDNPTITLNGVTTALTLTRTATGDPVITIPKELLASLGAGQSLKVNFRYRGVVAQSLAYQVKAYSDPYMV